jgi:SAM-dependent methyltransferase
MTNLTDGPQPDHRDPGGRATNPSSDDPATALQASLGVANEANERAWPGMPEAGVMSEHTTRYAFALGLLGGKRVLDLGCGTGYGSEMLSWTAASVRGFDLWRPTDAERPHWPRAQELNYGHDLSKDPLPDADAAVMFEVMEHLPEAPSALEIAFSAVPALICSFPNPDYHGSSHNPYHVNDWTLDRVESEVTSAATRAGREQLRLSHLHQLFGAPLLRRGRAPHAAYWIIVADASGNALDTPGPRKPLMWQLRQRLRLRSRLGLR